MGNYTIKSVRKMRATSLSLFLVALAKAQQMPDPADLPGPADVVVPDPADVVVPDPADVVIPDPADVVADLPDSGAVVVDPSDAADIVDDLLDDVDTPVVTDPADVEDDPSALEETLDDVTDAFSDFTDNLFGENTCFGAYAAQVGEVGDADYREALCITDAEDGCDTCMNWDVCVAEANVGLCDEGSSAGLVVGLILAILAAVAIGIVVYCFCCKGDDDDYQKQ